MAKLPDDVFPISIALKTPKGIAIPSYSPLFPTLDILLQYKNLPNPDRYRHRYTEEVLNKLNLYTVLYELRTLAESYKKICLLCYERSDTFCHRHIIRDYFNRNMISYIDNVVIHPIREFEFC